MANIHPSVGPAIAFLISQFGLIVPVRSTSSILYFLYHRIESQLPMCCVQGKAIGPYMQGLLSVVIGSPSTLSICAESVRERGKYFFIR